LCGIWRKRSGVGKHENLIMQSHLGELVNALGKDFIKNVHHDFFFFIVN